MFGRILDWIFKFLLGDDIFISYSRADGATYAAGLANKLAGEGFSCRFDLWGTQAGTEMPVSLKKALKRSAVLVLVGTAGAARSDHVLEEIVSFKKTGRTIIPIVFDGVLLAGDLTPKEGLLIDKSKLPEEEREILTEAKWANEIRGLPISCETAEALVTGVPMTVEEVIESATKENPIHNVAAEGTVNRIKNTFKFSRKDERLRKTSQVVAVVLLVLLIASATAFAIASIKGSEAAQKNEEARKATNDAQVAANKADFEDKRATRNAEIANQKTEEANRKTEEARIATIAANTATKRATAEKERADDASKLADEKTREAVAATKEAKKQTEIAAVRQEESRHLNYAKSNLDAIRFFDSGQSTDLQRVLAGTAKDLRGFEWNYLRHLPEGLTDFGDLTGLDFKQLIFSHDGRYFVSNGGGAGPLLWDADNGTNRTLIVDDNNNVGEANNFTFSRNNNKIASCGPTDQLVVWNVTASGIEKDVLKKGTDGTTETMILVSFNPENDNELFTVTRKNNEFLLDRWDIAGKRRIGESKNIKKGNDLYPLKFSRDGRLLVKYVADPKEGDQKPQGELRLSLLDEEFKETVLYPSSAGELYRFAFTEQGINLLNGDKDDGWDIALALVRKDLGIDKKEKIENFVFSPTGSYAAILEAQGINLWDVGKKQLIRKIPLGAGSNSAIAFSPDGSKLIVGGYIADLDELGTLSLWNTLYRDDVFTFYNEKFLALSSDGRQAVTLKSSKVGQTEESALMQWDTVNRRSSWLAVLPVGSMPVVAFSEDSSLISANNRLSEAFAPPQVWDARNGHPRELVSSGCAKYFTPAFFSPDGSRVADLCVDGNLYIWKVNGHSAPDKIKIEMSVINPLKTTENNNVEKDFFSDTGTVTFQTPHISRMSLRFFQDGRKIALSNSEGILMWVGNIENRTQELEKCTGEKVVNYSPDGKWRVTLDHQGGYRLRNSQRMKCNLEPFLYNDDPDWVTLAFSESSRYFAASDMTVEQGHFDNVHHSLIVLDLGTLKEVRLDDGEGGFGINFSPKDLWVKVADNYWNLHTGKKFPMIGCTSDPVFSADEKEQRLMTSCGEGTIKFWSTLSGQEILSLKAHSESVQRIVLMPDNKHLVTAGGKEIKLWNTELPKR